MCSFIELLHTNVAVGIVQIQSSYSQAPKQYVISIAGYMQLLIYRGHRSSVESIYVPQPSETSDPNIQTSTKQSAFSAVIFSNLSVAPMLELPSSQHSFAPRPWQCRGPSSQQPVRAHPHP